MRLLCSTGNAYMLNLAGLLLALSTACGGSDQSSALSAPSVTAGSGAAMPSATLPATTPASARVGDAPAAMKREVAAPTIGGSAPPSTSGAPGADVLPCGVSKVLAASCQGCHGAKPIGGAPMALVTHSDLQKPAPSQPTLKTYEVVQQRIHDTKRPMPPVTPLTERDMSTLDAWLQGGAIKGTAEDEQCALDPTPATQGGNMDFSKGPLIEQPGWKCYDFTNHNSTTEVDDTPYDVGGQGEHYEQFYFDVPWEDERVAVAYGTKVDNEAVLHHWLLFATDEGDPHGSHKTSPLPTLVGTNPVLLTGWALGGPNLVAPEGVGFELPNPGKKLNVQWHFYNSTGMPQQDRSAVQICTVPKEMVQHVGSVTWLGTEDLGGNVWSFGPGMPPHQESTFTSTCTPSREGMNETDPIHILGFEPHMHRIGKRMRTDVLRPDGTMENIFDKPFSFGNETHYYQSYDLLPGEKLVTSCTFDNDNDFGVAFGESSDSEMCYNFVFAYPAHSLRNRAPSLLGVTDTCW